ncbi:MAG: hypothetical protein ACT4PE_06395 [Candidatus Eiseniibacteriota bacterium]
MKSSVTWGGVVGTSDLQALRAFPGRGRTGQDRGSACPPPAPRRTGGIRGLAGLLGIALTLWAAPLVATAAPAPQDSLRPAPSPRWIFALEDTLRIETDFTTPMVEIVAERLRIGEIVDRCIRREEELAGRIESHEYTMLSQAVFTVGEPGPAAERAMVVEQADRHFFRKPNERRTIPLKRDSWRIEGGERKPWDADDEDTTVQVTYDDLADLPFYLGDRGNYDFEILSRRIVGDRVFYEVRLTPKSDFEIAPSGRIWVDTSTFSIVREEFDFGDRVPLPMFIKRVGPYVRERERIGDLWVWKRVLIRVELRGGLFRWMNRDVPDVAEFVVLFQDHRLNQEWSTQ